VSPPSRHTDEINRFLRAQIDPGENVLASGTGVEPRRSSTDISTEATDFFLVTPRRLLWSPTWEPRHRASLEFDAVSSWSDGMQYHRYALAMTHDAIERIAWAPEHRVLWFEWGDTEELRHQTRTILHFSSRGTHVAEALRSQFERRRVAKGVPLAFQEVPREERTAAAVLVARRRWRDRLRP